MKDKFKIGLYEEDPFELVSKNFQEEMQKIHGCWCPGMDDRIFTKTSHSGETRYALRVYPDQIETLERDELLKDRNTCFYCDTPEWGVKSNTRFNFSGFWEAQNYFAETTQLLDYDIHNVYEFDDGKLNGTYLSYAVIDFEQIYERFYSDLWDSAGKVFGETKLNKYFDKFDDFSKDKKVFKEFINILHFLNPSLNIYQNSMSDCELIDEVSYPLLKSKVEFYASKKNHNNFSLDEIFYDKSQPLYFVFETGFFINNAKNGVFERFLIENNSQKIARTQYKDDVIEKESLSDYKINKNSHFYKSNF